MVSGRILKDLIPKNSCGTQRVPGTGRHCLEHGMEHGKAEIGAVILLRISQEFGKSIEWLLTGER